MVKGSNPAAPTVHLTSFGEHLFANLTSETLALAAWRLLPDTLHTVTTAPVNITAVGGSAFALNLAWPSLEKLQDGLERIAGAMPVRKNTTLAGMV